MRKGIFILLIAVTCSLANLFSQTLEWTLSIIPVSDYTYVEAENSTLCSDNNDNLYAITTIHGVYNVDTSDTEILIGEEDVTTPVLSKISPDGTILWSKTLLETDYGYNYVTDAACDADGNLYITGYFQYNYDFNPGDEEYILEAQNGEEMFIMKLNSDGDFLWAKQYGHIDGEDDSYTHANAMKLTETAIYIAGDFIGKVMFDEVCESNNWNEDAFVLKLTLDGTPEWSYYFGSDGIDRATAIDVDNDGNAIVSGSYEGTVEFAKGNYTNEHTSNDGGTEPDMYITKINNEPFSTSGVRSVSWVKVVGGSGYESCSSVLLNENHVYFSGNFGGRTDFNYGWGTRMYLESREGKDSYLAELLTYSSAGVIEKYVRGGWFSENVEEDFDKNKGLFMRNGDLYALERATPRIYDTTDFSLIFDPYIPGGGIEMTLGNDGSIYVLATFENRAKFRLDRNVPDGITFYGADENNLILYKLDPEISSPQTSIASRTANSTFEIYPNPATDKIFFENNEEIKNIIVYNLQGVQVKYFTAITSNSISVSDLKPGVYVLKAEFDNNTCQQSRFVKQ